MKVPGNLQKNAPHVEGGPYANGAVIIITVIVCVTVITTKERGGLDWGAAALRRQVRRLRPGPEQGGPSQAPLPRPEAPGLRPSSLREPWASVGGGRVLDQLHTLIWGVTKGPLGGPGGSFLWIQRPRSGPQ